MLFNLVFASNTISSCFVFFFLIINLYFLTAEVIIHIFNPIAGLVISIGILSKEAKAEIETHSLTVEAKIGKCSKYNLESYKLFILLTHQFILIYVFKEINFNFFYIFQSKFYVIFQPNFFKINYIFIQHSYILLIKQRISNVVSALLPHLQITNNRKN